MLYLLDANVLIRAPSYCLDQVPQFWKWRLGMAKAGNVKMPFRFTRNRRRKRPSAHVDLRVAHQEGAHSYQEVDADLFDKVMSRYGTDLTDSDLEKIGRDPLLIAYALAASDRVIVTKEVSKPSKKGANRKIPDVCNDLGVKWMTDFEFFRTLGFTTR